MSSLVAWWAEGSAVLAAAWGLVVDETPVPLTWLLIGGLAAGVLRFVWGALCWMLLKHHDDDWRGVNDGGALEEALAKADLPPGWFWSLPDPKQYEGGMSNPGFVERLKNGPNAIIVPVPKGGCMGGTTFLKGFLLNLLEGVGLAVLVCIFWTTTAVAIDTLPETFAACAAVGLLASISIHWMGSTWMGLPWRHAWSSTFDMVVGYGLAGSLLWWLASQFELLG